MSSLLTLLFAPTFLIFIKFFDFQKVVIIYIVISLLFFAYALFKKKKAEDFYVLGIYLSILFIAYFNNDFATVKFIPVLSALAFFAIFAHSVVKKNELIYKFTTRVYKKQLSDGEILFLKQGDLFWSVAIFIYAMFLLSLVYFASDAVWAFSSSIGWYIYFGITLFVQVTYGKMYAIKMLTK